MEDETASVLFAEIVKFLENLPDGVGQTRLCSLLSRSDLADLIRLRKAAGIVQGRDIRNFVRLVIQKRTAGRGANVIPFLRFVIPFLTDELSCHSPRSRKLLDLFRESTRNLPGIRSWTEHGPSSSLLGASAVSADFFSGAERSGDIAGPQEQAVDTKALLPLLRASVLPSGERIALDEPGDLHVSSLPEDLDGAFQKREDSGVRDVSRRLSFWYGSFSGGKILSFGSMPVRFCSSEFSQMQSVVQAAGDTADLLIASGILSEICHHAGGETVYVTGYGPYGTIAAFAASSITGGSARGGLRAAVFNAPGLSGSMISLLSWKAICAAAASTENVHSSLDCYQDTGLQIGHRLLLGRCMAGQRSPAEMYGSLQELASGSRNAGTARSAAESLLRESLGMKADAIAGGSLPEQRIPRAP